MARAYRSGGRAPGLDLRERGYPRHDCLCDDPPVLKADTCQSPQICPHCGGFTTMPRARTKMQGARDAEGMIPLTGLTRGAWAEAKRLRLMR